MNATCLVRLHLLCLTDIANLPKVKKEQAGCSFMTLIQ